MTSIPQPMQLCGYCGAQHDPTKACGCDRSTQARAARRAEIERRLIAQRLGVAGLDPTQRRPRAN